MNQLLLTAVFTLSIVFSVNAEAIQSKSCTLEYTITHAGFVILGLGKGTATLTCGENEQVYNIGSFSALPLGGSTGGFFTESGSVTFYDIDVMSEGLEGIMVELSAKVAFDDLGEGVVINAAMFELPELGGYASIMNPTTTGFGYHIGVAFKVLAQAIAAGEYSQCDVRKIADAVKCQQLRWEAQQKAAAQN